MPLDGLDPRVGLVTLISAHQTLQDAYAALDRIADTLGRGPVSQELGSAPEGRGRLTTGGPSPFRRPGDVARASLVARLA